MATVTRTVTRQVEVEVPLFKGLPLVGNTGFGVERLLEQAIHCIATNWEGEAQKVFVSRKPADLDPSWFQPNDKSTLSVYGVNAKGDVIFGMACFEADPRAENELEREPHYFIEATNHTKRW